jgi:hypothetical protein
LGMKRLGTSNGKTRLINLIRKNKMNENIKNAFYQNIPCKVLLEYGASAVIEINVGLATWEGSYEEPSYSEGIDQIITVNKSYIHDKEINPDETLVEAFKEAEKIISAAKIEANDIKNKQLHDAQTLKRQLEKEINDIKAMSSKFKGLEMMFNYLNGDIKYAVYVDPEYSWRFGIIEIDKQFSNGEKELVAVSFRAKRQIEWRKTNFEMYLQQYSDSSGSKYKIEGFKTKEEALGRLISFIDEVKDRNIYEETIRECDSLGIKHPRIEDARKIIAGKNAASKARELEELRKKILMLE